MTDRPEIDRFADRDPPPEERAELGAVARRLEQERPVPRAGFRGELRRRLAEAAEHRQWRPQRLRFVVAAYAGSGIALLAIAALGVAGAGPLAAG